MVFIYILRLKQNKYYVGKTNNPQARIDDHYSSNGSSWTKKYKPIEVVELIDDCDDYDEDKYTLKYMNKYGIDNVRGGSFCQIILNQKELDIIQKMINGSNNNCYKCNGDHFVNECDVNEHDVNECDVNECDVNECDVNEYDVNKCDVNECDVNECDVNECDVNKHNVIKSYNCRYCSETSNSKNEMMFHESRMCKRKKHHNRPPKCYVCKRINHSAEDCYAKKDINGVIITKWDVCYRCGSSDHWRITCKENYDIFDEPVKNIPIDYVFRGINKTYNGFKKNVINKIKFW